MTQHQCTFRKGCSALALLAFGLAIVVTGLMTYRKIAYREVDCWIIETLDCQTKRIVTVAGRNWTDTVNVAWTSCQRDCCEHARLSDERYQCLIDASYNVVEVVRNRRPIDNIIWMTVSIFAVTGLTSVVTMLIKWFYDSRKQSQDLDELLFEQ